MVALESKVYQAALCKWCNEPIPIPKRVADFKAEIEQGGTDAPNAFVLRCRVCEHENIYLLSDIHDVEGEPRKRTVRAKAGRE